MSRIDIPETGGEVRVTSSPRTGQVAVVCDAHGAARAQFRRGDSTLQYDANLGGRPEWRDATDKWPTVPKWARAEITKALNLNVVF